MTDTIVALATPPGRGGVGIIRISGELVPSLIPLFLRRQTLKPRYATYQQFYNESNEIVDIGIALYFEPGASFTGEPVLELQGHGGPVIMDAIIKQAIRWGCRQAKPGEFSERAFLNGQMDLTQAEAIADLIDASSEEAARCAMRSLQGEFSKTITAVLQSVVSLRTYLEASNDFPEEDIEILEDGQVEVKINLIATQIEKIQAAAAQGVLLQEGASLAILGEPNAGKSSLFNALTGQESAIVTATPGTTRDLLKERILISGQWVNIMDTAGLREASDEIESEGIQRARRVLEQVDCVLFVIDALAYPTPDSREHLAEKMLAPHLKDWRHKAQIVVNKIDCEPSTTLAEHELPISAKTGEGLEALRSKLSSRLNQHSAGEGLFTARRRHLDALKEVQQHLSRAEEQLASERAVEFLAEDMRQVQIALGEITGKYTSDDLLGEIFSSFCIGK